ncbi:MAG TPA: DNA primase [Thermoanaerobaculia bacterium]|nr:DNA primase [Thermoanaerobaculia bacterium]
MAFVDLNDAVISRVRESADIVEFINQVTPLKQAGKSHKGLCPFHREKTPSFHVDKDKGLFYCFGCGTGGDVFKFLTLSEKFTFPEAVEHVAHRLGIELPTKKQSGREGQKDDLLELLADAEEAYKQAINWSPNVAETYLRERGVSKEIVETYGFGYAPDSWDYLLTRLGGKYGTSKLEAAGLVLPKKTGSGFYDRFRNRLMVPIRSESSTVIGFGGRSLDGSDPKYLNSPESSVFNKSHLLYNLNRAKDKMRKMERAILVEGYFDAITLDHAGIPGVVASMGTSLTPGQASILRKYAPRVVISYDGDDAGRAAALRAAPILYSSGLAVDIIDVGRGEDPDTLVRSGGSDRYLEVLASAKDAISFALNEIAPNPSSLTSRERGVAVDALMPLVSSITDPVTRNDSAQRIADAFGLQFETVWSRVRSRGPRGTEKVVQSPISTGEKRVLRLLLHPGTAPVVIEGMQAEYFEDPSCRVIFSAVCELAKRGQQIGFHELASQLRGDQELTLLSELALWDEDDQAQPSEELYHMRARFTERRLSEIQQEIQQVTRAGDSERERSLDAEKHRLLREKMELSRSRSHLK